MTYDPRVDPWQIDETEFYEIESPAEALKFLLRYAVLAPSGHNTQPWSFRVGDGKIEVHADFTRRLSVADPTDRELLLSIGAAITNLRVAASHFGFETLTGYSTDLDGTLVAVLSFAETCSPDSSMARLFPAIVTRRTNRQPFLDREIEPAALGTLCDFVEEHASTVRFVLPHDRPHVEDLIETADQLLLSDEEFRNEIARWLRPNEGSAGDGICGDAFGIVGPISALAPWMLRRFDMGPSQARRDRQLAHRAAGILVITAYDDRTSLVRAGETLERLLLVLTKLSIAYSFLNQPVQIPALRKELWSMLRSAGPPQALIRFGIAAPLRRAMPRRPIDNVLR